MKLENQVCSLEQGKRLKELGVEDNCYLGWIIPPSNGVRVPIHGKDGEARLIERNTIMYSGNGKDKYPAFTVAELGVMLLDYCGSHINGLYGYTPHPNNKFKWVADINDNWDKKPQPPSIAKGNTEAEARADLLIYLLENNLIEVTQVNERLKNA